MARPVSEHPTDLELEILKILWSTSPLTVREVRDQLETGADRPLTHSSVITILNIMYRKGYVKREKAGKSFQFSPAQEKQTVTGSIMGDLLSRVFEGSSSDLVLNLLETAELDSDELAELRKLITRKAKELKE